MLTCRLCDYSSEWNVDSGWSYSLFPCPSNYFRKVSDLDPMFHQNSCCHAANQLEKDLWAGALGSARWRRQDSGRLPIVDSFAPPGLHSAASTTDSAVSSFYQHIFQILAGRQLFYVISEAMLICFSQQIYYFFDLLLNSLYSLNYLLNQTHPSSILYLFSWKHLLRFKLRHFQAFLYVFHVE